MVSETERDWPPAGARLVLGAGVLLGFVVAASMWVDRRHMLGMNFRVYRAAAGVAGDGAAIYATSPPGFPDHTFLYPPVTLLAFLPFRLVAAHGTMVALLLFFPSYLVYLGILAYPLVPLLYLLSGRRARLPFVAGALPIGHPVTLARATEVLAAIPVPAGVRAALLALLAPVLTLGTPPLYGGLLTLAGCLVYARGRATQSPRD